MSGITIYIYSCWACFQRHYRRRRCIAEKIAPLKCTGKLGNDKMAVVCTCPASSGAVAPIVLQVLRGHAFCDTWKLVSISLFYLLDSI